MPPIRVHTRAIRRLSESKKELEEALCDINASHEFQPFKCFVSHPAGEMDPARESVPAAPFIITPGQKSKF
jgi:hypothetical protein